VRFFAVGFSVLQEELSSGFAVVRYIVQIWPHEIRVLVMLNLNLQHVNFWDTNTSAESMICI
jgi:hypothetical protein